MAKTSSRLKTALGLASMGFAVFPLHTSRDGICSCGKDCGRNNGKHPRTEHGHLDATTDPARIRAWWTETPDANIGVATGRISNLFVIDVDRHEGEDAEARLQRFAEAHGGLLITLIVRTGSGGLHAWFSMPEGAERVPCSQSKLAPKIDVRADGGYVVAPGSMHASGREYAFVKGAGLDHLHLAPVPRWLVDLARAPTARRSNSSNAKAVFRSRPEAGAPPFLRRAASLGSLTDEEWGATVEAVAAVWPKDVGIRHHLAMAVAHVFERARIPTSDVPDLVGAIARTAGDEDEIGDRDRSKAAYDALADDRGFGWPYIRASAPEVCTALQSCPAILRCAPSCILEDLDEARNVPCVSPAEAWDVIEQALESASAEVVTGIGTSTGSGKTTCTLAFAMARARRGLKTGIVVPTYKLLWEPYASMLREASEPFLAVLSVTAKDEHDEYFCQDLEQVMPLASSGWDARKTVCWKCRDRKTCPARRGKLGDTNACIIIGTHQQLHEVARLVGPKGVIVVDEAVGVWRSDYVPMSKLQTALAATDEVLKPSCLHRDDITHAIDRLLAFTSRKSAGTCTTLDELLGPASVSLAAMHHHSLVPTIVTPEQLKLVKALGEVLGKVLPAVGNPFVKFEVSADTGGGLLVHGPDPYLLRAFQSITVPLVFLDATLDQDEVRRVTGKAVREVRVTLPDSVSVSRTVVVNWNGTRKHMVAGSKPQWKNIVGPIRDAIRRGEAAGATTMLLITLKPVADALRHLLDARTRSFERAALTIYGLLQDWLHPEGQPDRVLHVEHYPMKGTNQYEKVDMLVTLGDPWINKSAASHRADWLGVNFERAYRRWARELLEQAHGRARQAQRLTPLTCVHYGLVVPGSWTEGAAVDRLPAPGRPSKLTEETAAKIRNLRAAGMTWKQVAVILKIPLRTVQTVKQPCRKY